MKILLVSVSAIFMLMSCSKNPNGNGGNTTTVTICNQVWMVKNLDVSTYRNGDTIPNVTDPTQWNNLTTGAWCYSANSSEYGAIYGKLYNWYAVNDSRGLAPAGWHIPSDGEWNKLVKCLDPTADTSGTVTKQSTTAGDAMKEAGSIHWVGFSFATNSSGFTGLPGGGRSTLNGYGLGYYGNWWSSTKDITDGIAWPRGLDGTSGVIRWPEPEKSGFSVRCIKD